MIIRKNFPIYILYGNRIIKTIMGYICWLKSMLIDLLAVIRLKILLILGPIIFWEDFWKIQNKKLKWWELSLLEYCLILGLPVYRIRKSEWKWCLFLWITLIWLLVRMLYMDWSVLFSSLNMENLLICLNFMIMILGRLLKILLIYWYGA